MFLFDFMIINTFAEEKSYIVLMKINNIAYFALENYFFRLIEKSVFIKMLRSYSKNLFCFSKIFRCKHFQIKMLSTNQADTILSEI